MFISRHLHLNHLKNQQGYTIIEALIALSIFSIGFLAVGALQTGALLNTGETGRKNEAATILTDQVERLKALPFYDDPDNLGTSDPWLEDTVADPDFDHKENRAGGRFEVHWRVTDDDPIGQTIMPGTNTGAAITVSKTITVSITPPGGNPVADALLSVEFVKVFSETM